MFGAFAFGEGYFGDSPIGPAYVPVLAPILEIRCGGADTLVYHVGGQDHITIHTGGAETVTVRSGADVG